MGSPHCRAVRSNSGIPEASDTTRSDEHESVDGPNDDSAEHSDGKDGNDTKLEKEWIPRSRYKREQQIIKRQQISVVFNISDITLTVSMEKVLNRGLNFAVLPVKLDITQVLVDWRRFERTMIWREWWYGREDLTENIEPIFKAKKNNLPKNYKVPNGLKTYINSVKSEIVDPKNRNKIENNLPAEELKALKELVQLQRERQIIIKQCDKGAGIMIMNFSDYMKAAKEHLEETMEDKNGNTKPYYTKVHAGVFEAAKNKLMDLLNSGYDNEIITKQEFEAMCPEGKTASRFYCNFKIHKTHEHVPPVRAIISGSGSILENPSKFVDHHIKDLAIKHHSYLQDTPDFIRKIEEINNMGDLPSNTVLATFDVKALFTNIPQEEGIQCTENALNERENQSIPTEYITRMLKIILKNNIFSFDEELYSQDEGTSMGPKHAPHYADIFMARNIDPKIKEILYCYLIVRFLIKGSI